MTIKQLDRFNISHGTSLQKGDRVYADARFGCVVGATGTHVRVRFDGALSGVPCDPKDVRVVSPESQLLEIASVQ